MQTELKKRLEEERDRHVAGYPGPRRDVAELLDDALSALSASIPADVEMLAGQLTYHATVNDDMGRVVQGHEDAGEKAAWPRGTRIRVEHDGFEGVVLNPYVTLEGKRGQVCQQHGNRVVHVYGEKWLQRVDDVPAALTHPAPTHESGEAVAWEVRWFVEDMGEHTPWSSITEDTADHYRSLNRTDVEVRTLYTRPDHTRGEVTEALPDDLFSHHAAWRKALELARDSAEVQGPDIDDRSYWQHEIDVLDKVYAALRGDAS